MSLCERCKYHEPDLNLCKGELTSECEYFIPKEPAKSDAVHQPSHYTGGIECIDYLRDKLTPDEFIGFCMGNVLKYSSRWRKKDGVQDLKKAEVYLGWAIQAAEKAEQTAEANP